MTLRAGQAVMSLRGIRFPQGVVRMEERPTPTYGEQLMLETLNSMLTLLRGIEVTTRDILKELQKMK